ncbi:MAG: YcxB family protein [Lachnospiraceae bacterium]|nr:YcxB family protein [Lachnospiraceae bacterium]
MDKKENENRIKFDVKLTKSDIFSLLLNHSYIGPMGIVTGIIVIATIVLFALKFNEIDTAGKILLIAIFIIYMAINPIMLYMKASKQAKATKDDKPLTYEINEENILIGQGVKRDKCPWSGIIKARETGKTFLLYVTKYTAFIWPKEQIGADKTDDVRELIKKCVKPSAMKIRK